MPRYTKQEIEEAATRLREWLEPGATVYCVLRHVSQSGMMRAIDLFAFVPDDDPKKPPVKLYLSGYAARLGDRRLHKNGGIVIEGCGMDMGFALVYDLGCALYPNGGPLNKSPREHQEKRHGRTTETDGGYLLRHEWL